ncbi:hypothetical protein JVT61DRAFT_7 [Boletus reticuloceps]|uniref:Uncharacterized protein n=1 Tax=Boletus reticuloceps TaxID=495285 RepID=A0A8I2YXR0_9AGAM|nr:hypothetical protein JVT61DRAFT_7 [Boletus reticuloceps]
MQHSLPSGQHSSRSTTKPTASVEPRPARASDPHRVCGYKKFGRDHNLEEPGISRDALQSASLDYLMLCLPGPQ